MATRSVVAQPIASGWEGRYVHNDGYPTSKGPQLQRLVRRDGLSVVRSILIRESSGWSSLNPEASEMPDYSVPDGAFVMQGYGVSYGHPSHEDDWITNRSDDMGTEWAYVLTDKGIAVFENRWTSSPYASGYRWRQVTEEPVTYDHRNFDWLALEREKA